MKKILIGGSPCTNFSKAQSSDKREIASYSGIGWELFYNYLIAREKFKPDFFLYENVASASKDIKAAISKELGVELVVINSALVSAQNRNRIYGCNWEIEQPEDRGILFRDILQKNRNDWREIGKWAYAPFYGNNNKRKIDILKDIESMKSNTLTTKKGHPQNYILNKERTQYTNLTIEEYETLQTLPVGYTEGVPESERFKMVGNGWTAEVIIHILNEALKDISCDEELHILSMYDGIGTGRYCLDRLGFTNVKYHAYEIDKYAIQVAKSNYPDIIECGDAFAVRENGWKW